MDLQLTGKTAFITGSTSGIGFAAARALAMEGVRVILNGRDAAGVSSAIERMKKIVHHGRIEGMVSDFSKPDQIKLLALGRRRCGGGWFSGAGPRLSSAGGICGRG